MKKKAKHPFSSVISVNPHKESYFSGSSKFLFKNNSPKYDKDQYAISYLNTKNFITSQISISKNIPDEDIYDAIYNKVYDELALDQALNYQIEFIETFNSPNENNNNFLVFIVDPSELKKTFANVVSKIKYIDTIIPSPLLLKSLYQKNIIESNGVDAFIYFQENDASITIYREKEFLYTKSINFSFLQMHERFCELYGERVLYEDFIDFLSNSNLKDTQSDFKEYFIKLYKEIFAHINDILTYVKRAYDVKKIEHIYIDLQMQTITKLDEMSEVELGVKSSSYDFNYIFKSDDSYIDQLHFLMHLYTTLSKEERYNCNFTTFHRPPKFVQRQSGKLFIFCAASFVIAFLYPFTYWSLAYAQNLQYELLYAEYTELHNMKITREAIIKNKEADKTNLSALLDKEQEDYAQKKATLIKIHDVKVNYPMKAKLLTMFTKDLNKFTIKVNSIAYDEDKDKKTFTLNLLSKKDKEITQMIEYLTKAYEGKYDFSLRRIELKNEPNQYFSELKVLIL